MEVEQILLFSHQQGICTRLAKCVLCPYVVRGQYIVQAAYASSGRGGCKIPSPICLTKDNYNTRCWYAEKMVEVC